MSIPSLAVQTNGGPAVSGDQLNTYQQTCDNMAQLRAFTGVSGIQVYARGTSTIGDGGQGVFYWNATGTAPDDNGITTVVPSGATSGEWTRLGGSGTSQASLTVTGNATIGGTLGVTGATSLTSLAVSGNATVGGAVTLSNLTASKLVATNASKVLVSITTLPTGTTATTQAASVSNTTVATTQFANPSTTNSANGSVTLPGGTIIKWGTATSSGTSANNITITFEVAFPSNIYSITTTQLSPGGSNFIEVTATTTGGATAGIHTASAYVNGLPINWIAIGD